MNLKTKAKGSLPKKKVKYPSRSTAAIPNMLTVCKKCGKSNDNGYQYCTACHKAHKGRNGRKLSTRVAQVSAVGIAQASSSIRDGVLRVLGNEGSEADRPR